MNLNELAKTIAQKEGGEVNLNIAEIKQVIKLLSIEMFLHPDIVARLILNGKKHNYKQLPKLPKFLKK